MIKGRLYKHVNAYILVEFLDVKRVGSKLDCYIAYISPNSRDVISFDQISLDIARLGDWKIIF